MNLSQESLERAVSTPASTLTQEQRDRMHRQRELAIARRNARLASHASPAAMEWSPARQGIENVGITEDWIDLGEHFGGRIDPSKIELEDSIHKREGDGRITMSLEQLRVLEAVAAKKSVFVTGSAGTGKSFILEYAIKVLRELHGEFAVFVTASTGIAACSIGGTTLHSFAGVGLGQLDERRLAAAVMASKESRSRWTTAKALVIDEISMIDAELWDKVDYVGRAVRNRPERFGGLQLLVTGDFFQLPPVQKAGETKNFAFQARCWRECFDLQMELTYVFRQSDRNFVAILDEIRRGRCSSSTIESLKACSVVSAASSSSPPPTRLFPHLQSVDRVNKEKLAALGGEPVTYIARDVGKIHLLSGCRAESQITLAVGAEVMLVKNIDTLGGLVNGTRGVLVDFMVPESPRRDFSSQEHEEQGARGRYFSWRDGKGKEEQGGEKRDVERHEQRRWPVVVFRIRGGLRKIVVKRESWSVMDGEKEVATRCQIPLILAWALSIHKCQGMTLDLVETDLTRSFECGMVYVALSRARSLEGIRLLGFNALKIRVHPLVVEFYHQLEESGRAGKRDFYRSSDPGTAAA
ncbi:ATP-dependent DNA helicase pfh1-like [Selaginella moellendorffii]|uniref:ATP-dependent DNA helicase pfh1-like n=1 Tax=Selaginella moellendorffii TaxID=88036 RepID=UPI000D1C5EE6|nr:ATP-dependent DNA helicase pfh1-like [Selaginella moellendorffii]|eukprot:XP_024540382.1 ATP-dependent DNA helicase pfh1-like [Selaginella moellendorffii]